MAEIINLKRARKTKSRNEADKIAATNRQIHGTSKKNREQKKAAGEKTLARFEAHRREPGNKS